MRIIDTKITRDILSGDNHPQLKIAGEMYIVDDRQSTFDKIQEIQKNTELNEKEKTSKIYELALGKEASDKIASMDLPVENARYLTFCVMGAIVGEDPDKLMTRAEKNL